MKIKQYLVLFCTLFLTSSIHPALTAKKQPKAAKTTPLAAKAPKAITPTTPVISDSEREFKPNTPASAKSTLNPAPYTPQLKALKSVPANVINAWQALYQIYLQNSPQATPALTLTPAQKTDLDPLFSTNFFTMIENYTDAKHFPSLQNDPESTIHTNYATTHINKTAARLASISSIDFSTNSPTVQFTGDNRDLGIIVNIQNNSQAQFSISQNSLDGKESVQIGLLTHGLNAVNLHTAALQSPATFAAKGTGTVSSNPAKISKTKQESKTLYYFELEELDADNPTTISLEMMTGTELITFLRTLPRKPEAIKKDTFEMNGLPTSPDYLANPKDYYLVLIQNPTSSAAQARNPDQRIQAINISKLSGPYLLTMQINPYTIEPNSDKPNASTLDIYQPSINTVLLPKNKFATMINFPFMLLPQFLWNLPDLQPLWMLYTSTYIAALTNFKFFGKDTFANAYEYFTNLGCFEMKNKHVFFIDLYNITKIGTTLFDAPWLMATILYDTQLNNSSDISMLHCSQDSHSHIIGNDEDCFYLNFQTILPPHHNKKNANAKLFQKQGFNAVYGQPVYQLWTLVCNIPIQDVREGIFAELTETMPGIYQLLWMNKKNKILSSQVLYLNAPVKSVKLTFVSQSTNWKGSYVPSQLLTLKLNHRNSFKVIYESLSAENKYMLAVKPTSPIDKSHTLHTTYFSKLPISNLYYELYKTFQGSNLTQCYIIQNSSMPSFLENLTTEDWQNGIYFIPSINSANPDHELSAKNPGYLTLTFYKSNKTILGHIDSQGAYNKNISLPGIREPVTKYSMYSNVAGPFIDFDLSTGLLFKYIGN